MFSLDNIPSSPSPEERNIQLKLGLQRLKEVKVMAVRQPRYSKEEFARRGDEIYKSQVCPQVEEGDRGKIVAITSGRLRQRY